MIYKSKLLYVFIFMVLLVGCEKKEHSVKIQMDLALVSVIEKSPEVENSQPVTENFIGNKRIEIEENLQNQLILDEAKEGTQVELILKRPQFSQRGERIVYVDSNVTELYFLKCSIIGVEGLEQLKYLETIVFDKCSDLQDFSFLSEVSQLKRLFIEYITKTIDWCFIGQLPNLEVLYIDFYRQPTISVNFFNCKKLEYIGFTSGVLETFPLLYNVPNSLKYLNLEGNKIASLPYTFDIPEKSIVLLGINPFLKDEKTPANITVEFSSRVIQEEKYRMPLYIPFITDAND